MLDNTTMNFTQVDDVLLHAARHVIASDWGFDVKVISVAYLKHFAELNAEDARVAYNAMRQAPVYTM